MKIGLQGFQGFTEFTELNSSSYTLKYHISNCILLHHLMYTIENPQKNDLLLSSMKTS